jgi:hypothetical protein
VGMGGVYGPKQPQPVVLCLRIDGCTPLDLLRNSEHLTPTTEAPSSSQSFRELPQREVRDGLCTSPLHHPYEGVREARPLYSSKVISSKRNITKTTPTLPLTRYLLLRGRAKACPGPIGPGPPAKGRDARWVLWLLVHAQEKQRPCGVAGG